MCRLHGRGKKHEPRGLNFMFREVGGPNMVGSDAIEIFEIVTCRRAKKAYPRLKFSKILYCLGKPIRRFSENTDYCLGKNKGRKVSC